MVEARVELRMQIIQLSYEILNGMTDRRWIYDVWRAK